MTIHYPLRKSSSLAPVASNVAQLAQIARQLCYAGYLSTDMIVWLQSIKFLRIRAEYVRSRSLQQFHSTLTPSSHPPQ